MMRDVYTVRDDATVREVAALLLEAKTSGVPVVDDANRVLGFISDGDIMRGLARQESVAPDLSYYVSAYRDDETLEQKVAEVLSSNVMDLATRRVVSVDARADLEQVCKVLAGKRIKKLPVLSEGRLVGCVSRSDIVRELMGAFISEEREAEGAA